MGASSSCESCGANSSQPKSQNLIEGVTTDGIAQAISLALKDARKARLGFVGIAVLIALLLVVWLKYFSFPIFPSMPARPPSVFEQALSLVLTPADGSVYEKKAIFGSAMVDISVAKNLVYEYFFYNDKFPSSLSDLDLDEESMKSQNIESLKIESEGVISAQLTQAIGDNIRVRLAPELIMDGYSIQWNCSSNLSPVVLSGTRCEPT